VAKFQLSGPGDLFVVPVTSQRANADLPVSGWAEAGFLQSTNSREPACAHHTVDLLVAVDGFNTISACNFPATNLT
jgi:hypothetical protein